MRHLFRIVLIVALVVWFGPAVSAEPAPPPASEHPVTMNFQNVDISVLAKFISQITGKSFVLDEGVRGKVSIIKPGKVTPEQAYSIFMSALQLEGFTTVDAEPVIKIIPSRDLRRAGHSRSSDSQNVRARQTPPRPSRS